MTTRVITPFKIQQVLRDILCSHLAQNRQEDRLANLRGQQVGKGSVPFHMKQTSTRMASRPCACEGASRGVIASCTSCRTRGAGTCAFLISALAQATKMTPTTLAMTPTTLEMPSTLAMPSTIVTPTAVLAMRWTAVMAASEALHKQTGSVIKEKKSCKHAERERDSSLA